MADCTRAAPSHTPGPWVVMDAHLDGENKTIIAPPESTGLDESVTVAVASLDADDYIGNARLIAAAPDLLAALEEIAKLEGWHKGQGLIYTIAVKAIAKAKGGSL